MRWINDVDPRPLEDAVTLDDVNEERTVCLIDDAAAEDPETLEHWLKRNYAALFEMELEDWYTDPALWPQQRSYQLFQEWFEPECHTVIIDMSRDDLFDDDT